VTGVGVAVGTITVTVAVTVVVVDNVGSIVGRGVIEASPIGVGTRMIKPCVGGVVGIGVLEPELHPTNINAERMAIGKM
jgi:hypothetical protein